MSAVTGVLSGRGEIDMDFIAQISLAGHAVGHLHELDEMLAKLEA